MTMTRKDYVEIAKIINKFFDSNIEHPVFNDTVHSNLIEPFPVNTRRIENPAATLLAWPVKKSALK